MKLTSHPKFFATLFTLFLASPTSALEIVRVGSDSDHDVTVKFATCLAGGALDESVWDKGWKYFLSRAPHGDVLVIHANRDMENYAQSIYDDSEGESFGPLNSVTEVNLQNAKDAEDPRLIQFITQAEVVFFAGGDQSYYVDWFANSTFIKILQSRLNQKEIIAAGTSAGMAFLAGIDFAAHLDSPSTPGGMVVSQDVLQDPMGAFADLNASVLIPPFMSKTITETHFSKRNREGRVFGFMAKAATLGLNGASPTTIRAIAADEDVIICYDETGLAQVFGTGNAYFLEGNGPIQQCTEGKPLIWKGKQKDAVIATIISSESTNSWFNLQNGDSYGAKKERWWTEIVNGKSKLKRASY